MSSELPSPTDFARKNPGTPPSAELLPSPSIHESIHEPTLPQKESTPPPDLPILEAGPGGSSVKPNRFRRGLRAVGWALISVITAIWIGFAYGILGLLVVVGTVVPIVILAVGIPAANGALILFIGNIILRATHHPHYTTNAIAAAIGGIGGAIATPITTFLFRPRDGLPKANTLLSDWCVLVLQGTLSGAIGTSILQRRHVDLQGIDVLHATRAGALGSAVLGPGFVFAVALGIAALGAVFMSLFATMALGLEWVGNQAEKSWENRGKYEKPYLFTYGILSGRVGQ